MLGCGENNSKKGVKPHKILPRLPLGSLRSLVFRCCPQLRSLDRGYRFIELTVKREYYTALLLLGKESIEWLTLRVFRTVKFAGFMPVKGVKYYLKWKSHRFFSHSISFFGSLLYGGYKSKCDRFGFERCLRQRAKSAESKLRTEIIEGWRSS